jgi:hypothetical protein
VTADAPLASSRSLPQDAFEQAWQQGGDARSLSAKAR